MNGQVPNHLIAGARSGFLQAMASPLQDWRRVAQQITIDGADQTLVDLGAAPMPTRSKTGMTMQSLIERSLTVAPVDWDITIHCTYNDVMDDRTNTLLAKSRQAGSNFNKHVNQLVFKAINAGDSIGDYGACYDGQALFSDSHIDEGAQYQTAQDNKDALTLDNANFETVYVKMANVVDDRGEFTAFTPNLLVVPPALMRAASQISGNERIAGDANNDINPYFNRVDYVVAPWLDSTAWALVASSENVKPILVVMRQTPFLQDFGFDSSKPNGGWYWFKYFARYHVAYGDWRLISMGNT